MTTDVFFNENKTYANLEQWLDNNILHEAYDLVELLFDKELVNDEDIKNFYKTYDRKDFDNDEDYVNAINDPEPQDVYEWYLVSEEGYEKFSKMGDRVFKWKNMHFWGRPCAGQRIIMDFQYSKRLKLLDL
jgi:hypothetical protein